MRERERERGTLLLVDGDVALLVGCLEGGQWGLYCEHAILGELRLDLLRVGALGQKELPVVLPIHRPVLGLFLVFGVHLQPVVDGLDNNLFRGVLGDVEAQLELLGSVLGILNERRVHAVQPGLAGRAHAWWQLARSLERRIALGEEVALVVHELGAEARHLLLHLAHLGLETLADRAELIVQDAEVGLLDGHASFGGHLVSFSSAGSLLLVAAAKAVLGVLRYTSWQLLVFFADDVCRC